MAIKRNQRQRKKMHLAEFQELGFLVIVYGFYGLNDDGYAELLESKDNKDILVSYDNRKKEHVIQTFEDLVRFNGQKDEQLQKQSSDVFGEQDDENENTDAGEGKAKSEKFTRKTKTQVKDKPNRSLPKLIEELLNKNIKVGLSKNGYYSAQ